MIPQAWSPPRGSRPPFPPLTCSNQLKKTVLTSLSRGCNRNKTPRMQFAEPYPVNERNGGHADDNHRVHGHEDAIDSDDGYPK